MQHAEFPSSAKIPNRAVVRGGCAVHLAAHLNVKQRLSMKRLIGVAVGLLLLAGGLALLFRVPLTLGLMDRVLARNMGSDLMAELPDGLHVAICGAGAPLPDPKRSGPCVAVMAGERLYIVDAGGGSSRVLARMRVPIGRITAVLLTHYHSDHIDGLGALELQRWANAAATEPVPVMGPGPDVHAVVDGINLAYGSSRAARVAHHGAGIVPPGGAGAVAVPFDVPDQGQGEVLVEEGGLTITAFLVDHAPVKPAVGYRFDYAGRSVLISGDTTKSSNLAEFAQRVDLLVHEALAPDLVGVIERSAREAGRDNLAKILADIVDYHTSPVEAAEIARDAGVGHLLFHHIVPPLLLAPMETLFLQGVDAVYAGPVTISRDGTLVRMDAHTSSIIVESLL